MIRLDHVTRRLSGTTILDDVCVQADAGQTVFVIGPSGSGKTSLLRIIAGLDRPDAGDVMIAGETVTARPPERRPVAMVFQEDALFPELTVTDNIGFGLRGRAASAAAAGEAVNVVMLRLGLTGLENRFPHQLSGGQQRRVALARALVLRPRVLLLDEPMRGLDDQTRAHLSRELHGLPQRHDLSLVHATHDQAEALAAADLLVVMDSGRVVQQATPQEVFTHPATASVAAFMGRSSFLDVSVSAVAVTTGGRWADIDVLGQRLRVPAHPEVQTAAGTGGTPGVASLMVRPHAGRLTPALHPRHHGMVEGNVGVVQRQLYRGDHLDHVVETAIGTVTIASPLGDGHPPGSRVEITLDPTELWLLP